MRCLGEVRSGPVPNIDSPSKPGGTLAQPERAEESHELICFGDDCFGQCRIPADLGKVVAVKAGAYHTCAVRPDGASSAGGNCVRRVMYGIENGLGKLAQILAEGRSSRFVANKLN